HCYPRDIPAFLLLAASAGDSPLLVPTAPLRSLLTPIPDDATRVAIALVPAAGCSGPHIALPNSLVVKAERICTIPATLAVRLPTTRRPDRHRVARGTERDTFATAGPTTDSLLPRLVSLGRLYHTERT